VASGLHTLIMGAADENCSGQRCRGHRRVDADLVERVTDCLGGPSTDAAAPLSAQAIALTRPLDAHTKSYAMGSK